MSNDTSPYRDLLKEADSGQRDLTGYLIHIRPGQRAAHPDEPVIGLITRQKRDAYGITRIDIYWPLGYHTDAFLVSWLIRMDNDKNLIYMQPG